MFEIIYNPRNIKNVDIEEEKVRVLITNSKNEILVANYNDLYLLPGGKIEKDESIHDALKREVKEEIGVDIKEFNPLVKIEYYQDAYPTVSKGIYDRKVTTHYFTVNKDIDLTTINNKLSEREKKGNFKLEWINENELKNIIKNDKNDNPRKIYFDKELLQVLEIYKKGLGENCLSFESDDKHDSIIDLHTHTCYSDGELTPNELIEYALKHKVGTLAITDHDTVVGLKNINNGYNNTSIKIIPGIELSAKIKTGRMHILGYGININNEHLNKKLIEIKNNSIYHIISLLHQIKKDYNIVFSTEDIQELINANHNLNRVDLAKLCIKYGFATYVQEAFDKYLIDANKKIEANKSGLDYTECIDLIIKAGGIPVLAHPNSLELNDIELLKLIKEMVSNGLQGIECYHSSFTKDESLYYLEIANKLNLLISGGSDFHGKSIKPDVEIGTGKNNNLHIRQLTLLDKLKRY